MLSCIYVYAMYNLFHYYVIPPPCPLDLAIGIITWLAWIVWRPKEITNRLLLAGTFVMVATYFMDAVGLSRGLWSYPIKEIPLIPSYIGNICIRLHL